MTIASGAHVADQAFGPCAFCALCHFSLFFSFKMLISITCKYWTMITAGTRWRGRWELSLSFFKLIIAGPDYLLYSYFFVNLFVTHFFCILNLYITIDRFNFLFSLLETNLYWICTILKVLRCDILKLSCFWIL